MSLRALLALLTLVSWSCAGPRPTARPDEQPGERPPAYWQAIVDSDYALPAGESAYPLIVDLSRHLGSPDSVLRDDFGYGIPAAWIYTQELLDADEARALVELWSANLRRNLGRSGDDSVLLRSFSALNLALLAAYDSKTPFLGRVGFSLLLSAALDYLAGERDLRGWSARTGWLHSAAHTADLLKFLARSSHLAPAEQEEILLAIAQRLHDTRGYVFVHGEDERLTETIVSILAREDFEPRAFAAFLEQLLTAKQRTQAAGGFDPELFAAQLNSKNVLRALYVRLARASELAPALLQARADVLDALASL